MRNVGAALKGSPREKQPSGQNHQAINCGQNNAVSLVATFGSHHSSYRDEEPSHLDVA
jgi:hypothetical protein